MTNSIRVPSLSVLATLATLKYFSYTDDLEQFFVDAVDHYLFRLVFGSTQPVLGQDPVPPPDIPYHHAMPAFEAQAPMIAAVG